MSKQTKEQTAIVLGGSMAGLMTARVLADHFKEVVILERDELPETAQKRRGTPQAQHVHFLLKRGVDILEDLFPGIFSGLEQDGAVSMDMTRDLNMYLLGNWRIPFQSGVTLYSSSRILLEHHVRQRVMQVANIRVNSGAAVKEYLLDSSGTGITGVSFQQRSQNGNSDQKIYGSLVIDATGIGSRSPQWLEAMGFPRVEESEQTINVRYTTARFRVSEAHQPAWKAAAIYMEAPGKRIGAVNKIEDDQYIVTLVGKLGEVPPSDPDGFLEYARTLPQPDLYDLLKNAERLSDFVGYRLPSNLRRHYEKMTHFPEGFAVIGAAVCTFNPTFAQGMATAAMEVMALDEILRKNGLKKGSGRKIQKAIAGVVDVPWMMATSEDMRHPEVGINVPMMNRFMNWYVKQVQNTAGYDRYAHRVFMDVMNMLSSPPRMFEPRMLYRVLRHVLMPESRKQSMITVPEQTPVSAAGD